MFVFELEKCKTNFKYNYNTTYNIIIKSFQHKLLMKNYVKPNLKLKIKIKKKKWNISTKK